ncbi:hypothetical protein CR513_07307, partial [Mucuna pruriens]
MDEIPAKFKRHDSRFENAGDVNAVSLRSGIELPQQPVPQPKAKLVNAKSEPEADSLVQQQARAVPLPFPTWTVPSRKFETDEDLLKMLWRVEINIPLIDAIK